MKSIITTPIFYVNSKPHIGHFYSLLFSDAIKKSNFIFNKKSILSTGTDEHGLKIVQSAQKAKSEVKTYCDDISKLFIDNAKLSKIDYDDFIRTTEVRHKTIVELVWKELFNKGFIKMGKYEGYYCVSEERFMTNKELMTNDKGEITTLDKKKVELISEESYSIKLNDDTISQYKDLLCSSNDINKGNNNNSRRVILQESQINEVKEYMNIKLNEFTVSRPKSRVSWGIEVPNDPDHVIYVWFDALINYITVAVTDYFKSKFLNEKDENLVTNKKVNDEVNKLVSQIKDFQIIREIINKVNFTHVIGKDITKFHCYLYPMMLIAANLLPNDFRVITHHHFQVNNIKMSKSLNNSLFADQLISKYGLEALRYHFIAYGPQIKDVSLEEKAISSTYYNDIADTIVNLIMRFGNKKILDVNILSKIKAEFNNSLLKNYNKTNSIQSNYDNASIETEKDSLLKAIKNDIIKNNEKFTKLVKALENYEFSTICFGIHAILLDLNKIVHLSEFWKVDYSSLNDNRELYIRTQNLVLFSLETIRISLVLLYPFIPDFVTRFYKILNLNESSLNSNACEYFYLVNWENPEQELFKLNHDLIKTVYIEKKRESKI